MAQHDYIIANQSGAAFRADLNNGLAAIVTQNSGAAQPSTTYAYQWWADTTTGLLKLRNAANNDWITLFQLDGEWTTLAIENGTATAPSLYFKDSGTDTGIFSPGADQLGIATGGVERVEFGNAEVVFNDGGADVDFRVEGDTNANLFKIDAGLDQVQVANLNGGPLAGFRNRIINGDMRIAQRGTTSFSTVTALFGGCDRWLTELAGFSSASGSVQQAGSLGAIGSNKSSGFVQEALFTSTGSGTIQFVQRIEAQNSNDLSGKAITVSFSISQDTGSAVVPYIQIIKPAALDNWTSDSLITSSSLASLPTETLTRYTFTTTLGASDAVNGLGVVVGFTVGAVTSKYFQITDVQLEPGSVATPFERRSIGTELALCQRYFQKNNGPTSRAVFQGYVINGSDYLAQVQFPVAMRITPAVSVNLDDVFGFPSGAGTVTVDPAAFTQTKGSDSTQNSGYFISSWTASAEL